MHMEFQIQWTSVAVSDSQGFKKVCKKQSTNARESYLYATEIRYAQKLKVAAEEHMDENFMSSP